MGFSDRFAAYISQGFETYDELAPPLESRRIVLADTVYSMYAAFTIAADADPDAALLDMVVMVTLVKCHTLTTQVHQKTTMKYHHTPVNMVQCIH